MTRYHQLAEEMSGRIRAGVLRPGERMPSVRSTSRSHRVSPATVTQAYKLLEDRGEIHARSRSGHYVSAHLGGRPMQQCPVSRPSGASTAVDVRDLVFELIDTAGRRDFVALGSAFPAPDLFPLRKLARALHSAAARLDPQSIYEQLVPGNADLRRLIARRYLETGCDVPVEEIVITTGALEGLNLCLQAVTQPGDVVVVESPTFYAALQALERLHLQAVEVETDPVEGVRLDALETLLQRQKVAACWFMPTFQNPLGALMPNAKKQALVQLLARHAQLA